MSLLKIIRELFTIAFGVLGIALVVAWDAEWYYAVLGVVLIAWGSWDIYKELRDKQAGSAVDESAGARAQVEARLHGVAGDATPPEPGPTAAVEPAQAAAAVSPEASVAVLADPGQPDTAAVAEGEQPPAAGA